MNTFMKMAIEQAKKGITLGHGGPFGAVIVKNGEVIAKGHNCVVKNNDPTCHGEMMAIRSACKKLNSFNLSGCELYTTGFPCPMCFGAILWANIEKVYYGCTTADTELIGFRDKKFEQNIQKQQKSICTQIEKEACTALYKEYNNISNKTNY